MAKRLGHIFCDTGSSVANQLACYVGQEVLYYGNYSLAPINIQTNTAIFNSITVYRAGFFKNQIPFFVLNDKIFNDFNYERTTWDQTVSMAVDLVTSFVNKKLPLNKADCIPTSDWQLITTCIDGINH